MLSRRRINLAMMSAIAMIGMCSPAEAGLTTTPEAQEKRARRATKRAKE